MNERTRGVVLVASVAKGARALVAALVGSLAALSGCVDVNGAAVEISWSLQTRSGGPNSCREAGVGEVVLKVLPEDEAQGLRAREFAFPCGQQHGTTEFAIAPGRYAISLAVECSTPGEAVLDGLKVPAPVVRDLVSGQVVNLDAWLILAGDSNLVCGVKEEGDAGVG